jgi:V/A-type H+-transporting ATPase subunit C
MSRYSSAYLDTRLDIFASRLIGFDRLKNLIDYDLERILQEIQALTGNSYNLDADAAKRIERQLTNRALEDFQVLIRPFSGSERRFFNFSIRWFELVNLKVLIRGKFSGVDSDSIRQQLVEIGSFADLPIRKLLDTDDPYEMLRLLETTAYGGIVRQARRVYEEQGHDLFLLDATIDRSYFIDLYQRARFLGQQDFDYVSRVLDSLLDRFNLLWLLRYRFSYGLSPAKSFYLLTVSGKKLHSIELMRLARLDSVEKIVADLPQPYRSLLANCQDISEIETVLEYYSLAVAADMLNKKSNLLARCFSYILLREAELRFLQALIKGKQLGFSRELIKQAVGAGQ